MTLGYGDWYFYPAALAVVELLLLASCALDVRLRGLLRRRPMTFHFVALLLTATALYGSDSNKHPEEPEPPAQERPHRIYVHRGNGGGRWVWTPLNVLTTENKENEKDGKQ